MAITKIGSAGVTFPDGTIQESAAGALGQTWASYTASRSANVWYTNSTGKTIMIAVIENGNGFSSIGASVSPDGGTTSVSVGSGASGASGGWGHTHDVTFLVPNGWSYIVSWNNATSMSWSEMR